MKKTLLLMSALFVALFTNLNAQEATNLLENGGFEAWDDAKTPTCWTPTTTAGGATLAQSTDARTGSYSVDVANASGNKRIGYKELTLKAGTYTFGFYAKSASADGLATTVAGYVPVTDGKAGQYAYGTYANNVSATEWTYVSTEFTLEATTTVNLVAMVQKASKGHLLIDDAELTTKDGGIESGSTTEPGGEEPTPPVVDPVVPLPVEGSLLENGDFETWENSLPVNWKSETTAGNATLTQSTDAHAGSYSVQVANASANKRLAYKELTLKAGTYTFGFYAKSAAEGKLANINLGYVPVTDGKVGTYVYRDNYQNNVSATEWTPVSYEFTLDQVTTVNLVVMIQKTSAGAVLIDDAVLTTEDGGLADEGEEPEPPVVHEVTGIAAIKAAGAGDYVLNLEDAVVTYVNGSNAYIEDATGGMLVYKSNHGLVAGQKISGAVKTTLVLFSNLNELTAFDASAATITDGAEIPVTTVTVAELNENFAKYESMRVKVVGVTASALESRKATLTQGESTIAFYQKDTKVEFTFAEGDKVDVVGYPGLFMEDKQFNVWDVADVTPSTETGIAGATVANGAVKAYTLDGRVATKLVKGVYIVNGKKVIVK